MPPSPVCRIDTASHAGPRDQPSLGFVGNYLQRTRRNDW
jgi:hypothetical protein